MRFLLRDIWRRYELVLWRNADPAAEWLPFREQRDAYDLLSRLAYAGNGATLRQACAALLDRAARPSAAARLNVERACRLLARELAGGRLRLVRREIQPHWGAGGGGPGGGQGADDEPDARPRPRSGSRGPAEEDETRHWIKIRVVDDDTDEPLRGVPMRLKLPDGKVARYTTDGDGMVSIRELPDGSCDLEALLDKLALEVIKAA